VAGRSRLINDASLAQPTFPVQLADTGQEKPDDCSSPERFVGFGSYSARSSKSSYACPMSHVTGPRGELSWLHAIVPYVIYLASVGWMGWLVSRSYAFVVSLSCVCVVLRAGLWPEFFKIFIRGTNRQRHML
jgi:hypothetical protein